MTAQSQILITRDLLARSIDQLDRAEATIRDSAAILDAATEVLDRAISIAGARPYMVDARRDGDTMHNLQVDRVSGLATLAWARKGTEAGLTVMRCTFPARLLDMTPDALWAWQADAGRDAVATR